MARTPERTKREAQYLRFKYGLFKDMECTPDENQKYAEMLRNGEELPEGIHCYLDSKTGQKMDEFYMDVPSLSKQDTLEYIQLLQLKELASIRKCAVFFTILAIISISLVAICFLIGIAGLSHLLSFLFR